MKTELQWNRGRQPQRDVGHDVEILLDPERWGQFRSLIGQDDRVTILDARLDDDREQVVVQCQCDTAENADRLESAWG